MLGGRRATAWAVKAPSPSGVHQAEPGQRETPGDRQPLATSQRQAWRPRSWDDLSESESPRHTLQTKTKAMAAQMHNPTPATAQDTPTYAKVTINATQASTRKILIGHPYEETPHQRGDDLTSKDCPGTDRHFARVG
jgi:hypothetical protein